MLTNNTVVMALNRLFLYVLIAEYINEQRNIVGCTRSYVPHATS
jgi:hypothetical protein